MSALAGAALPLAAVAGPVGAVLHDFVGSDGDNPSGKLVLDGTGALYGTTFAGGRYTYGTAYKLTPPAAGSDHWTTTVLHTFAGERNVDGSYPAGGLVADAKGNLFGTTWQGPGPNGQAPCSS